MQGLEISRKFYEEYGAPMLRAQFPELEGKLAAALTGSGSECYGYDDAVSADHDFDPGFCLFLPGEDAVDRQTAFRLERAYAKLPREYAGYARPVMQPVGGSRRGVMRISEFFTDRVGAPDGRLSMELWLRIPLYALAEATNGEVFFDGAGLLTGIREYLSEMPEDVRRKRLAGQLLLMAQSGQYNYRRCLAHGEEAAAQLAVGEFVRASMTAVFLLNRRYMPYYKWSFRAMRALPCLPVPAETMEYLLTTPNDRETAETKYELIEDAASSVIEELRSQSLTEAICGDLEKHAYSVNDSVCGAEIRNLHILSTV